jgi:hypothetical protein
MALTEQNQQAIRDGVDQLLSTRPDISAKHAAEAFEAMWFENPAMTDEMVMEGSAYVEQYIGELRMDSPSL